ncbi:MAG: diphosphate--fructose-6-phosphate 1-phosphotransferase [Fusobacteriaceae bacterium]|jgi:6-phosphofructokinase 1|nr:diphosphate--fructose-6-phosphate 1-phosphotransferase [Fusobacteriaceae bacterium]
MDRKGNALYIQSGGPTAVVNATAYGVITECRRQKAVGEIYAAEHGISGVIHGKLFDVTDSFAGEELLPRTPGMFFGSSRYEIDEKDPAQRDYSKILETLKAFDIRYIILNGGNGTVRAALRLGRFLNDREYPCQLIVAPKTVDNDVGLTDHAPGFASAARHVVLRVSELLRDLRTYDTDLIMAVEVMGRNTGFLAAAALAAGKIGATPDLIYVPEVLFEREKFLEDVSHVLRKKGKCFAVVAEGVRTPEGKFLFEEVSVNRGMDMKKNMGGIIPCLNDLLRTRFRCKIRGIDLGLMQRCDATSVSETDRKEALETGRLAVREAVGGSHLKMASIKRTAADSDETRYGLEDLAAVAARDKTLPLCYINKAGNYIEESYLGYILPLIGALPEYTLLNEKVVGAVRRKSQGEE